MNIELRPLTLGEILDRTFQVYRARFLLFFGIAMVASAIELVWNLARVLEAKALVSRHLSLLTVQAVSSVSDIISWAITFGVAGLAMAATNRAVTSIYEGKPTQIAGSYGQVRNHWFRYMWLNVMTFLLAWGVVVLIVAGVVVALLLARKAQSLTQARTLTFMYGIMGLLIFMALPLCIWLTVRYALANSASVTEGIGVLKALKRSVLLSKEMRGRIFVLLVVIVFAQFIFAAALTAPVIALLVRNPQHVPVATTAYLLAVGFASSSLIRPVYCIGLTLFYFDSRIRKEGFDVEWMLEHAPAEPPANPDSGSPLPGLMPG